jgi:hypothetical protein
MCDACATRGVRCVEPIHVTVRDGCGRPFTYCLSAWYHKKDKGGV